MESASSEVGASLATTFRTKPRITTTRNAQFATALVEPGPDYSAKFPPCQPCWVADAYSQQYVVFLRAAGGKIAILREYFDPTRAAKAMNKPILGLES
jgi:hypothetical protein